MTRLSLPPYLLRVQWREAERIRRTQVDAHRDSPGVCAARLDIVNREATAARGDRARRG
jgi:hypothetical protein